MRLLAEFDNRLARLSLHGRLWAVVASLALPMLLAALLAAMFHLYAVQAWRIYSGQEQYALELALTAGADLRQLEAPATRQAALQTLRERMRTVAALSGEASVRRAAQAATTLSYEFDAGTGAQAGSGASPGAALAPLLDTLRARAAEASAKGRVRASGMGMTALVAILLLPALAVAAGIALARRLTHSIDGTLRDCIAFAGAIASDNFSHGGSQARAAVRATRMNVDADSASEFDILVRSMNRIADETTVTAKRAAAQSARLLHLERSWALFSACAQSQLRAADDRELMTAVCAHLCEHGGYRAAWIGYALDDEGRSIEVAARAGTDANYIHKLALSWGDDAHQQGGFGTAVHQNRTMTTAELAEDLVFNAEARPAVPHGLLAAAALPLRTDPDAAPFGVLGLYSAKADVFTSQELALLQQVADDLVLGIARCRLHAQCVRQAEAAEAHPVYYDNLTGLATLETAQRQLAPLAELAAAAHRKLGCLHINLDSFEIINDKLGYAVADQLLVQAALRLAQAAGDKAVLARPGADEFIVLLPGLASAAHAGKIAARVAARHPAAQADVLHRHRGLSGRLRGRRRPAAARFAGHAASQGAGRQYAPLLCGRPECAGGAAQRHGTGLAPRAGPGRTAAVLPAAKQPGPWRRGRRRGADALAAPAARPAGAAGLHPPGRGNRAGDAGGRLGYRARLPPDQGMDGAGLASSAGGGEPVPQPVPAAGTDRQRAARAG
jgi:diguanylate cyclase (GGDEF)-like protein